MKAVLNRSGIILSVFSILLFQLFISCSSSTDSSGGSIDVSDFAGVWMAVGQAGTAEQPFALLLEVEGSNFLRVVYENTEQVEGQRGTFSISGNTMTVNVTENWGNNDWYPYTETMSVEVTLSGNTLTMPHPEYDEETITLTKTEFSNPANLTGIWFDGEYNMELNDNGAYVHAESIPTEESIGNWSASANMFRAVETEYVGNDGYIEYLYYYDLAGATLTLSWPGVESFEVIKQDTDLSAADFAGTWFAAGQAGTADEPYAVLIDFSGSDFTRTAYYETQQDEGQKGTFSVSGNLVTVIIDEVWEEGAWSAYSNVVTFPVTYSGTSFTMPHPDNEEYVLTLVKKEFINPAALVGTWNDGSYNTVLNADGTYTYAVGVSGQENSGNWSA
ncbi:MAG: hypothetical protein EH224_13735 [Calditrichaeota bacterium]|nr:MAG: hypothetical protein EH224_13735 [Calditrichota bacterium]